MFLQEILQGCPMLLALWVTAVFLQTTMCPGCSTAAVSVGASQQGEPQQSSELLLAAFLAGGCQHVAAGALGRTHLRHI